MLYSCTHMATVVNVGPASELLYGVDAVRLSADSVNVMLNEGSFVRMSTKVLRQNSQHAHKIHNITTTWSVTDCASL